MIAKQTRRHKGAQDAVQIPARVVASHPRRARIPAMPLGVGTQILSNVVTPKSVKDFHGKAMVGKRCALFRMY
jgi:hypothetical protein